MLHASAVGAGFIPVLAAAGSSMARINTKSTLTLNTLQKSASPRWSGFIPVLTASLYLFCISPAVGRTGINPAPTAAECCKRLNINGLHRNIGVYKYCDFIRNGRRSVNYVRLNDPLAWAVGRVRRPPVGRQTKSLFYFGDQYRSPRPPLQPTIAHSC